MNVPKWLQMVQTIAPMVLMFTPLAPIAPFVSAGIQQAELIAGATGKEKLAHAVEIARAGIAATNAQAGRIVVDPQLSDAAIASGINTAVAVVNIVSAAHAEDLPTAPVVVSAALPPAT